MGDYTKIAFIIAAAFIAGAALALFFAILSSSKLKSEKASLQASLESLIRDAERIREEKEENEIKMQSAQDRLIESERKLATAEEREKSAWKMFHDEEEEKQSLEEKIALLADKNESLNKELADMHSKYASETEKNKWVAEADKSLREAFNSLSKEISDNNNNVFLEKANDKLKDFAEKLDQKMTGESKNVENIINPVGEQLKELTKQVNEMEKVRASAYTGLNTSVEDLKKQNEILQNETRSLNSALRNNSVRGKWGEEQLRRIAELSGMAEHIDYEQQYVADDGKRPDMMIKLTGEKAIPVDSKVPMDDYLAYAQSLDESERKASLERHVKAVKKHIDVLAKKEYWKTEERSVQYVVMVIPYESGLSATFEADTNIFEYGMERNVLLLSPMTFYAFLKAVSLGWAEYQMNENAKEIARISGELIDRTEKFFEHFDGIGQNMTKTVTKYNEAVKSYNSRLLPTFNKLRQLKAEDDARMIEEVSSDIHVTKTDL